MERPTINNTAAMYQAGQTVSVYLRSAIEEIDAQLGVGYARAHPELVAEMVRAQTLDFNSCQLSAVLYDLSDSVKTLRE